MSRSWSSKVHRDPPSARGVAECGCEEGRADADGAKDERIVASLDESKAHELF